MQNKFEKTILGSGVPCVHRKVYEESKKRQRNCH